MELNFFRTVCATFLLMVLIVPAYNKRPILKHDANRYSYEKVLGLSFLFLEAQRSGILPHNNRISWRGDSAVFDKGNKGEDLTGGYYDGSDFVKFTYTMAFTTTLLAWGVVSWPDAYRSTGQLNEAREAIRWATDYLIKCHVSKNVLYAQVGNFDYDQQFWTRPEDIDQHYRPAYKIDRDHPGSDLAGETAAALAAASIVFETVDWEYSEKCLRHAKELFKFADTYRGLYTDSILNSADYYKSTGYGDELAWAAIWIYMANNDVTYLDKATSFYQTFNLNYIPNQFSYDEKVPGVQVLLAQVTQEEEYRGKVYRFCEINTKYSRRTKAGLAFIDKTGTLGLAANVAFICLKAASLSVFKAAERYYNISKEQIDYMLGDSGRSYVVGFGEHPPQQVYNPAASCRPPPETCTWEDALRNKPNPHILYGALVSGPDIDDIFMDIRMRASYTEAAIYYNAGFTGVLAGLIQLRKEILENKQDYTEKIGVV